ncbi:hypothetical protein GWO57_08160 [Corynebacterium macginleyi]|uniref:hypothetical protein n=1 Tax=Corynebacterium macginleyi TaxID=38290 RepID=UPI0019097C75|nr:hypothetical protein [Corynebacterium macginleyi]MBK4144607.1 hypothetical protein [Corynebacterium macginleyi]
MTTAKKNTTKKTSDEVEVLDKAPEVNWSVENRIYTEKGVELTNGVKVDVSVFLDNDDLPVSFAALVAEGNVGAMLIGKLPEKTRTLLDWVGATQRDLREVIAPVIQRADDLPESEKYKK